MTHCKRSLSAFSWLFHSALASTVPVERSLREVYCSADTSKSISKSTLRSAKSVVSNTERATSTREGTPPIDSSDYRPQWAEKLLETRAMRTLVAEFMIHLYDYVAPDRTSKAYDKNKLRSRYNNIPCYDQNRVKLKKDHFYQSDFIHANYMNAPDGVKYIATQGPLLDTRCDFWQMVVQEEVQVVLQLCKFIEGDSKKCSEYWPSRENEKTLVLDKFTIRKIGNQEEIAPGFVKTTLLIESGTINRTIQHISCDAWPDQLAPSDTTTVIKIWNYLKESRGSGPIVVHCSAGVGRTATFIGLSYGVEMLRKSGSTMIDVVKELRKFRPMAVQTQAQYLFLHAALLEIFIQMNLIQRTPQAVSYLEGYRKLACKLLEKGRPEISASSSGATTIDVGRASK